jgi:ParB family chromosome partitioning protein
LDLITPGRIQARRHFDEATLAELAASIATAGVIQPVVVCGSHQDGYSLLAGERRWRAAALANLREIPAIVRNDLSTEQAAVLGLIENLQRESLGLMETAHGLAHLAAALGLTHEAIAAQIGKSRAYVSNFLRLRRLNPPVQALIEAGRLSLGQAKILAGITGARQTELAHTAIARGWTVRQLERAARAGEPEKPAGTSDWSALEQSLSAHVGNPVGIRYDPKRRAGELRITFHDLDEFDGLLAKLGYPGE